MYVTLLSSTCFGPWHAHPQEEQLHKHSIWYPRSHKRLYTTPLSTGVVYTRLEERGYQMLGLCSCSSWGWACQGPKHVEDSNVTYMSLLNCALKLVEEIILYYDARLKKHQITFWSIYLEIFFDYFCPLFCLSWFLFWYFLKMSWLVWEVLLTILVECKAGFMWNPKIREFIFSKL